MGGRIPAIEHGGSLAGWTGGSCDKWYLDDDDRQEYENTAWQLDLGRWPQVPILEHRFMQSENSNAT